MGLTKTQAFTASENALAAAARLLAHPARIAILNHLIRSETCICGDLVLEIGLAQPTISQHLKELKNAGLIQDTIAGKRVCYCINPDVWHQLRDQLLSFLNQPLETHDC